MDAQTARLVLSSAADGGFLEDAIPEREEDLIDLASYYIEEARRAKIAGMNHPAVDAIIRLDSLPVESVAEPDEHEGPPPGESSLPSDSFAFGEGKELLEKVAEIYPRRSSGGISELEEKEANSWIPESNLAHKEGLPIPKTVEEAVPYDMPTDLTDLGDKELRRLYSAFNAYSGRARWLLAIAQSNLSNATHLRDEAYRTEYISELIGSQIREEKLSQGTLENLAKNSQQYKNWDENVRKHEKEVTQWRALVDIYSKNVDILSREWTMRTEQYERER